MCVRRADGSTPVNGDAAGGKRRQENAVVHVNSVLLAFLNTGSVVGSLAGSLIVGSGRLPDVSATSHDVLNATTTTTAAVATDASVCGVGHCPFIAEHIRAFASPDPRLVFVVGAVFLLVVAAATALTVVLRPLPRRRTSSQADVGETRDRDGSALSIRARIANTLRLLADARFLLLIPSLVTMGVVTSFAIGAFNQVQSNNVASDYIFDCMRAHEQAFCVVSTTTHRTYN